MNNKHYYVRSLSISNGAHTIFRAPPPGNATSCSADEALCYMLEVDTPIATTIYTSDPDELLSALQDGKVLGRLKEKLGGGIQSEVDQLHNVISRLK